MQTYFDELQKQGKKAVLRFAYERDFMGRAAVGPTGEQILEHLDQLKPFLEKNKDLILVVQAGMIVHGANGIVLFRGLRTRKRQRLRYWKNYCQ